MQDTERELEAKKTRKKKGGDQAERPITCKNLNKIDSAAYLQHRHYMYSTHRHVTVPTRDRVYRRPIALFGEPGAQYRASHAPKM